MIYTLKYLLNKKTRLFFIIGVISSIIALIITMNSLLPGFKETLISHRKNTSFSFMIVPNLSSGESGLLLNDNNIKQKVPQINGIAKSESVLEFNQVIRYKNLDKKTQAVSYIKGLTDLKLINGTFPVKEKEVVIDVSLTQEIGMQIGSVFKIKGQWFKVSGVTEGHRIYSQAIVFYKKSALKNLYNVSDGQAHYYLLNTKPSQNFSNIKKSLNSAFTQYQVITRAEYLRTLEEYYAFMNELFFIIEVLIFAIGLLVIGSTIFTSVAERKRDIGVLRAIGGNNFYLIKMIFIESMLITSISCVLGIIIGWYLILIFPKIVYIQAVVNQEIIVLAIIYSLVIGVISALLALRKVLKIDPIISMKI